MASAIAGGLGATSSYQAAPPPIQTQDIISQIKAAQANPNFVDYSQSNNTAQKQGTLADMLMAQANGTGPNPALNQLNQTTNQNIQQTAGQIASQKGISPGLAARLIAMNGANQNQNAAGQAATMNAQQQLGAESNLGSTLNAQRTGDITQATDNKNLQNQYIGTLENAQSNQNNAINDGTLGAERINADTAAANAKAAGSVGGGLLQGLGSVGASLLKKAAPLALAGATGGGSLLAGGAMDAISNSGGGGGDGLLTAAHGAVVPGHAPVKGDSPKNDTVPARLSPGEIVLPRSVTQSPEAAEKAKLFVEQISGKKSDKPTVNPKSYGELLQVHRDIKSKMDELEKKIKACRGGMVK